MTQRVVAIAASGTGLPWLLSDVELQQVVGLHAVGRVGLDDDALQPPGVREVVDVVRAERGRQHGVDVVERDAERARPVAVDVDLQLRRVLEPVGAHACEHLALRRHAEQLVARRDQRCVAVAAAVLEAEGEAGGGAELGDRRRHEREDERVAHAR